MPRSLLLFAALALVLAAPPAARSAEPAPSPALAPAALSSALAPPRAAISLPVARRGFGGGGFGSRGARRYPSSRPGYGRSSRRSPGARRTRGLLRGLFFGFLLGHWFVSGGFPVFLFLLLGIFGFSALRRRRRRRF